MKFYLQDTKNQGLIQIKYIPNRSKSEDYCFLSCTKGKNNYLEKVTLSEGLKSISELAFEYCISLRTINMPASIEAIGNKAFFSCKQLTDLSLPNDLTSIGKEAFYECSAITVVNIPEGVTEIGDFAFFEAENLKSIYLPQSLEEIGSSAFFGYMTDQLTKVYSHSATPPVCKVVDVFNFNTTTFGVLYVPIGASAAYRSAPMWDQFFNIQEINFTSIDTQSPDAQTSVIGRVGEIQIETPSPMEASIYTLAGVKLSTRTLEAGETIIALNSGMYIVKVGTEMHKVVVK